MTNPVAGPLPEATTRLGKYELVRLLAQGGMADVYLARQPTADRYVAVKVLSASRSRDAESCALFRDEARVVGLLSHANLAAIYDVDTVAGMHYLAMEYVHGADLREVLARAEASNTAIDYDCAVSIVKTAAEGLDHAHRRCAPDGRPLHLVHRDVSLSNIMVSHDGSVKVIDFGIAISAASVHTTQPGVVRGKASYMSPEQCLGDPVDLRTDVFALGVVLYELTTGRRCFQGNSDFERMLAVVRGDYVPPSVLVPEFPAALEQVIRTALSIDPAHRYHSAAAMIEALEAVALLEGWSLGPATHLRMMRALFGNPPAPWAQAAITTLKVEIEPASEQQAHGEAHPPTRIITNRRRFAHGTQADPYASDNHPPVHQIPDANDWQEDAPTRGRRSISRITYSPLAAA